MHLEGGTTAYNWIRVGLAAAATWGAYKAGQVVNSFYSSAYAGIEAKYVFEAQQAHANESGNTESTPAGHQDAENVVTGGAEPDRETSRGTKIYGESPTGKSADETMDDVKGLEGAESSTKETDRGKVEVVTLGDGSKIIDRPSKAGPRTIEIQNAKGRTTTEVRFPEPPPQ